MFKHATQQIEKSVVRATAKLKTLLQNIEDPKSYNIETQKLILIDDRTVEKQLLFNQIDQIRKTMHREKLDILPINFMGLVTKILTNSDSEYHSVDAAI